MRIDARLVALAGGVLAVACATLVLVVRRPAADIPEGRGERHGIELVRANGISADVSADSTARPGVAPQKPGQPDPLHSEPESEQPLSESKRREREETALVDAFYALTDKWMEPVKVGVSMKDVDEFAAQFRRLPKSRRQECLQRALNLVPDENVMLLAGILMDKSQDKEIVGLVYNDVLNRDESVKKPILREIFKDKTHPFWADTAWILDVTGELPGEK